MLEEFLKPLALSQYQLAKDISVPARRINEIVLSQRALSPDTALRLSRCFEMSEAFWSNLQARYDLELQIDLLAGRLKREVRVYAAGPAKRSVAHAAQATGARRLPDSSRVRQRLPAGGRRPGPD